MAQILSIGMPVLRLQKSCFYYHHIPSHKLCVKLEYSLAQGSFRKLEDRSGPVKTFSIVSETTPAAENENELRNHCEEEFSDPVAESERLNDVYGSKNLKFASAAGLIVALLSTGNGSCSKIVLQEGRVTSYKARMWHGGLEEILYTSVQEESDENPGSLFGGMFLGLPEADSLRWKLQDVQESPDKWIQLTLVPSNASTSLPAMKYDITLTTDSLGGIITVKSTSQGSRSSPLPTLCTTLSVSSPEGANMVGVEGMPYLCSKVELEDGASSSKSNLFSKWFSSERKSSRVDPAAAQLANECLRGDTFEVGSVFIEQESIANLAGPVERFFPAAPNYFVLLDRGFQRSTGIQSAGVGHLFVQVLGAGSSLSRAGKYVAINCFSRRDALRDGEWMAGHVVRNTGSG